MKIDYWKLRGKNQNLGDWQYNDVRFFFFEEDKIVRLFFVNLNGELYNIKIWMGELKYQMQKLKYSKNRLKIIRHLIS